MRPGAPCAGSVPAPPLLTPFLLLLLAAVCTAVSASKYFVLLGCCFGSRWYTVDRWLLRSVMCVSLFGEPLYRVQRTSQGDG